MGRRLHRANDWPELVQFRPNLRWSNPCNVWPTSVRARPKLPQLGRTLARVDPSSTDIARLLPNPGGIWPSSPKFGRSRSNTSPILGLFISNNYGNRANFRNQVHDDITQESVATHTHVSDVSADTCLGKARKQLDTQQTQCVGLIRCSAAPGKSLGPKRRTITTAHRLSGVPLLRTRTRMVIPGTSRFQLELSVPDLRKSEECGTYGRPKPCITQSTHTHKLARRAKSSCLKTHAHTTTHAQCAGKSAKQAGTSTNTIRGVLAPKPARKGCVGEDQCGKRRRATTRAKSALRLPVIAPRCFIELWPESFFCFVFSVDGHGLRSYRKSIVGR